MKTALVTGASRGIGKAIALELKEIIKKVEKYRQLRPAFVVNGFSSFLRYDMRDQQYYLNTNDRGI